MQKSSEEWTKVSERLPEIIEERGDSGHLLCLDLDDEFPVEFVAFYEPGCGWQVSHHFTRFDREPPVTHYRQLPERPRN